VQDRDWAKLALRNLRRACSRLKRLWAESGYASTLIEWAKTFGGWVLEIVRRCDARGGFRVLPKRWIVERTIGRIGPYRRMNKDRETLTDNSKAIITPAMINLHAAQACAGLKRLLKHALRLDLIPC
jgi:putative transposase